MDVERLLRYVVQERASDLHLQAGASPMIRVEGRMRSLGLPAPTKKEMAHILATIAPPEYGTDLHDRLIKGVDFSYTIANVARFRCSAVQILGTAAVVARVVRPIIASLEELNLPPVLREIAAAQRGLVVVAGTTGCGKSTTLAAMIDLINAREACKIITIEDPVETLHPGKTALVAQMEVGIDTPSFERGLRQSLRQDPDVILVGEMRDADTLRIALQAAATGHLVFTTVHSSDAAQTIERVIAMFPAEEHRLLLSQLANSVEAIVCQRLVHAKDGRRRPAVEILRGGPVTEKFILQNRLAELSDYISKGEAGMQTFDQHLLELYHEAVITGTEAMRWASNPEAMSMAMRGIRRVGSLGSGR